MQAILSGEHLPPLVPDDLRYVLDLGLLVRHRQGDLAVANKGYQEVIPKVLTAEIQGSIPRLLPTWLKPNGQLDPASLLTAFPDFCRQHGEPLMQSAPYHEAAPHLVLLAFLDRVANGGGRVEREYAVGTGRMDLLLVYGTTKVAIEVKGWRPGKKDPKDPGLRQLDTYLAALGLATGWLIIFDQWPQQQPVEERTTTGAAATPSGKEVVVVRA